MSTKATLRGGPSTANGLLYQLLWCVLTATELSIKEPLVTDGTLQNARLLVEPAGGGDVHVTNSARREVVQLKARTTNRTWSLTDVVKDVFPDLYRELMPEETGTRYVFVTEGRAGDWSAVNTFFQSLADRTPDRDFQAALDDTKRIAFRQSSPIWTSSQTECVFRPKRPVVPKEGGQGDGVGDRIPG